MRRYWGAGALLLCSLWLAVDAWAEVSQVFLVQNSGWMEPFYVDPKSEFRPLLQALIQAVAPPTGEVLVAEFNQSIQTHKSPQLIYRGTDPVKAAKAVERIGLVRKPGSTAFVDTDFQEAIVTTVREFLQGRPALIWLLTNNKNSPNNDQNTVAKNKEFYNLIHDEPAIKRVIAYPLGMPVVGHKFSANGLMIYALAYGDTADAELEQLLASGVLAKFLTERPGLLKPLDRQSISFVPEGMEEAKAVRLTMGTDRQTWIIEADASTNTAEVHIYGIFRNAFYPYSIARAEVTAHLIGEGFDLPLPVAPSELTDLQPGKQQPVTVGLVIAGARLPSLWSLKALPLMGTEHTVRGRIEVTLEHQELTVSKSFMDRIASIFPGDPLPEVFQPGKEASASAVSWPVEIRVKYPLYPLVVIGLIILLAVAALAAMIAALLKSATYTVRLEGSERRAISLRCFTSTTMELKDRRGKLQRVKFRRGFGQPKTIEAPSGIQVLIDKTT
ncbi:MAG: hypothetical protein D4R73_07615 [Deltaproteobacteria bacterium]|nr:MAG: hypothetical protein D4R73_07615 [Deltaproteobacteria bacterium]